MTLDGVQVWTVAQAATALRLTERTVQRLARAGELPAHRHGGRWLIHADTLTGRCG